MLLPTFVQVDRELAGLGNRGADVAAVPVLREDRDDERVRGAGGEVTTSFLLPALTVARRSALNTARPRHAERERAVDGPTRRKRRLRRWRRRSSRARRSHRRPRRRWTPPPMTPMSAESPQTPEADEIRDWGSRRSSHRRRSDRCSTAICVLSPATPTTPALSVLVAGSVVSVRARPRTPMPLSLFPSSRRRSGRTAENACRFVAFVTVVVAVGRVVRLGLHVRRRGRDACRLDRADGEGGCAAGGRGEQGSPRSKRPVLDRFGHVLIPSSGLRRRSLDAPSVRCEAPGQ